MYIVIDIGGTNIRMAACRDVTAFGEPVIADTPQSYDEALAYIVSKSKELSGGAPITAVAAGIPGRLSADKRSVDGMSNLTDWVKKPFADDVEKALATKVWLENDVTLVGLGEAMHGAGRGAKSIIYLTVSTGVNSIRIVEGHFEEGYVGTSTGRQYVSMENPPRTWEAMISGKAIAARFGVKPRELGKDHPVWEELARTTAFGLHNSVLHWTPERLVLGGSMFKEIGISVERVQFHLKDIRTGVPEIPEVVHSELGDLGGLWGGLTLLHQRS